VRSKDICARGPGKVHNTFPHSSPSVTHPSPVVSRGTRSIARKCGKGTGLHGLTI
jgi:hypothetical protein